MTEDRWLNGNEPEFMKVRCASVADIARASRGIAAIARILHNTISDEGSGDAPSMEHWTKWGLAGAVECISEFVYERIEEMNALANDIQKAEGETNNG